MSDLDDAASETWAAAQTGYNCAKCGTPIPKEWTLASGYGRCPECV